MLVVVLQVTRQIAVLNLARPSFSLTKYFSSGRIKILLALIVT